MISTNCLYEGESMSEPRQHGTISNEDSSCIEQVLTSLFPDDVETVGPQRLSEISANPEKPLGRAYRPDLKGEQADVVAVLDFLRDAAIIAYYSIQISIDLRKADPKGALPKKEKVKRELDKQIKEGKLKASAKTLKHVDKIIGALKDLVQ